MENSLFDFFDILNQILWGILFGSASRVNWGNLTVSEMVQDIESVSQRDCFICHIFWVCGLEIITLQIFLTCLFSWFETSKGACIKHFVMTSSSSSIFWLNRNFNRNCLQEFCCDLISGKLVFKVIYITILLYYTIHVVSFRKNITIGTHEEIHLRSLKGKFCIINIGENTQSVE